MEAIIRKIGNLKSSRNGNVYFRRISFILEDGSWAMTDLISSYRNYARWKPIIEAGIGTKIRGVFEKSKGKIDADSLVEIIQEPIIKSTPITPEDKIKSQTAKSASHEDVEYEITDLGTQVLCSCPGFRRWGHCHHIMEYRNNLAKLSAQSKLF